MTNEPNKRFPRVSDCCKKTYKMLYNNDPSSTQQYIPICTSCDNQCKIVADEGLPDDENRERRCTHGGVPGATWCTDCAACIHDPNYGHDFSKPEPQPSAPSMSIEEAKNLLKTFYFIWKKYHNRKDLTLNYHSEAVNGLIKASALIAASEQRERDAEICEKTKMEEPHLSNTDRGYLWNRSLEEAKQEILNQDSQQNISSNQN